MGIPESASEVFDIDTRGSTGDGNAPELRSPFPPDLVLYPQNKNSSGDKIRVHTRLLGNKVMYTSTTGSENSLLNGSEWNYNNGFGYATNTDANDLGWMWKRAPSFFDVVAYTGDGVAGRTVSHNLGVAPEMIWVKQRDVSRNWVVYSETLGVGKYLKLNDTNATITNTQRFDTAPTGAVFTVGNDTEVNGSGGDYIAYLFASLDGVSKVGSYTGNGTTLNIDCGFTSGARFVLIKRTDSTGSWWVFDTERGLVAGADAAITLDTTSAEFSTVDYIDPYPAGFSLTGIGGDMNANGGTYIFYAIA
jgi:hypothetical protein